MLQHLTLRGDLKFGQYKSIACNVQLEIDIHEEDDWAPPDPNYNPANYTDGVRITGELSFDHPPLNDWREKHPVKPNAIGDLTVRDGDESTKLNVIIIERTAMVDVIPRKLKKYFWHFYVIGKPKWDILKIFPENYRGVNMNRIYSCTNFRGYWPVGVASVIVAADKREAKNILDAKLREAGIPIEGDGDYTLTEIDIQNKGAVILNDGKWQ